MMAIGLSMRKAATENTTFTVLPLTILTLEKEGFRQFAKWHAGMSVEWETIAIGRDSCSLCNVAIGAGDRYTRVEIREEIETMLAFYYLHPITERLINEIEDKILSVIKDHRKESEFGVEIKFVGTDLKINLVNK